MFISSAAEIERIRKLLGSESQGVPGPSSRDVSGEETTASGLTSLFIYAGLEERARKSFLLKSGISCLIPLLLAFATGKIVLAALSIVSLIISWQVLKIKSFRRAKAFEADYTAMLLSLASAVRTGMDPLAALLQSGKLFSDKSEIRKEIESLKERMERGGAEDTVLRNFASTIEHPDTGLFTTAFILARKEGSSLSECLKRLVKVTRQRQSFRRKIKSAVAMQRLSSFGIAGCTLLIAGFQAATNMEAVKLAINHPLGFKAICFGVFMIVSGIIWMVKMTSSRI